MPKLVWLPNASCVALNPSALAPAISRRIGALVGGNAVPFTARRRNPLTLLTVMRLTPSAAFSTPCRSAARSLTFRFAAVAASVSVRLCVVTTPCTSSMRSVNGTSAWNTG